MYMCRKKPIDAVLTVPKGIPECRRNLQFTSSLDEDQKCTVKRVKKRKMISDFWKKHMGMYVLHTELDAILLRTFDTEYIIALKLVRRPGLPL